MEPHLDEATFMRLYGRFQSFNTWQFDVPPPVLATVWGTNVARSSVATRCFYSNGTVPTTTSETVSTHDEAGNDTVLVGLRGFYVRLRGHLHSKDRVIIDCWTQQLLDPFSSKQQTLCSR